MSAFDLFYSNGKYFKFYLFRQVLFEMMGFEILIYLVIKQNLLYLETIVWFMKMSARKLFMLRVNLADCSFPDLRLNFRWKK